MKKLAFLFAVSEYEKAPKLDACTNDLNMMHLLLKESGEFADILISLNDKSSNARDKLIAFVEKYKGQDIDQIFFYFSGHGYRDADQFYFCFKNTNLEALNSTTITSHDIDGYLKVLKPKVAVKVIDACYSGESYIKSMDDTFYKVMEEEQRKSFEEIYFMFSSRRTEQSLATEQHSLFTRLFLDAIKYCDDSSSITYKYIIDYISDQAPVSLRKHTPYFVTQGAYMAYLFDDISIAKAILNKNKDENKNSQLEVLSEKRSLLAVIKEDAERYCNEEEGMERINSFIQLLDQIKFSDDLGELFSISHSSSDIILYNAEYIGRWLNANLEKDMFLARERYKSQKVVEKKYMQYPSGIRSRLIAPEYKLENIETTEEVVVGIRYLIKLEKVFFTFKFIPKEQFQNLKSYAVCFTYLISKKDIVLFYSMEELAIANWNTSSNPDCLNWQHKIFSLKNFHKKDLNNLLEEINKELLGYIESIFL